MQVEWHGRIEATLSNVRDEPTPEGIAWFVHGMNLAGQAETWLVWRLSCGCQHSSPVETAASDRAMLLEAARNGG